LEPGARNAITDVRGVRVGHTTLIRGDTIRTGVTAVIPRGGNLLERPVRGAVHVANAYGKLMGSTQVEELGEIETPILLTSTLNVPRAADALIDYLLAQPGNERVTSINPLVAETSDRLLNDVRARPVGPQEVASAIREASDGPPAEGTVGAGTGTVAFGFKGGIGTASRQLPPELGGHRLGVLVQTNYGGLLTIAGAPVGLELGHRYPRAPDPPAGGSVIIVAATDAPVDAHDLRRLGSRAMIGVARTGSAGTNHSGDYAIAFSTSEETSRVDHRSLDPLFWAAIESTEEAIYNSLFRATTLSGCGRTVDALPLDATLGILDRHRLLQKP
jgi:D-aminopeptidase